MSDDLSSLQERLQALEQRIEKLTMANRALWEIMSEAHSYNDDKFAAKIAEIDLRDGALDGRLTGDHPRV